MTLRRTAAFLGGLLLCVLLAGGLWAVLIPKPSLLDGVPFSPQVFDRNGRLLRLGLSADDKYRVFVPLKEIAQEMSEAAILYEDKRFYRHSGVDFAALLRSFYSSYLGGGRRMGGSTISMQTARLRYGIDSSSIWGKLRQIERAFALELHYSKEEILEAYLNLAPYGGNIEGCGAAARVYFHKEASALNLAECLALASVPQNPARRNPLALQNDSLALHEARKRMFEIWLSAHPEDEIQRFLIQSPLAVYSQKDLPFSAPHVSAEAISSFEADPARHNSLIRTTIDSGMQDLLEKHLDDFVRRNRADGIKNLGALLLHWPSMEIYALAGSADFHDREISGQIDGTGARRSPGSTVKPFIYALAFDQGLIHPKTVLYDTPRSFAGYDPENADFLFKGPLSASAALALSRNIPAIQLANQLKKPDLYSFLQETGAMLPYTREHYGLSLVLGGAELSMRHLAALYAMLPNKGLFREPKLYSRQAGKRDGRRFFSAEAAMLTLEAIKDNPTVQRVRFLGQRSDKLPLYWKTGTSNGLRDAWTCGIFGPYVLVIWIGNFDNTPNPSLVGASAAAPLFLDIAGALEGREKMADLPRKGREHLNLIKVPVCESTGDLDTSLCAEVSETWFIPGVSPIADSGVYRSILIDKHTGLRACIEEPGKTERKIWEFWPTDLQHGFRLAGVAKAPPPPFLPSCAKEQGLGGSLGMKPEIVTPKAGVVYQHSVSNPKGSVIPLTARGDADVTEFFWFSGNTFIGRAKINESVLWRPGGGNHPLQVMDNLGRSSVRAVRVESRE